MRALFRLAASLVVAFAVGCTTAVEVSFDEGEDLSRHRTWAWLPGGRNVDAVPGEEADLDALTSRLVGAELRRRGFVRVEHTADLLVGYALRVDRRVVLVNETGAVDLLASHHSSPSYLVQATETRTETHDTGHLSVVVLDGARARVIWRGDLTARRRGDLARHLPQVVSRLLEELPARPFPETAAEADAGR